MKTDYPLYNKIYNKMKTISKKLDLQFDVEHSIKINYKKFNDTRFIFILSNYNDSNIIQKNISYIKNTLSLSTIPQYKKGHIIQFIYGIDIEDKRTKVYITVAHSKNDIKTILQTIALGLTPLAWHPIYLCLVLQSANLPPSSL